MNTSVTRPLFSVGEEVILVSENLPQFNGEYVVTVIVCQGETHKCRHTGKTIRYLGKYNYYGYILDRICVGEERLTESIWAERALRKKYPPSEFTFDELMNNLKLETVE